MYSNQALDGADVTLSHIFDDIKDQQDHWDYSFNEFTDTQHLDSTYYNHLEAIQIALKISNFSQ